MHSVAGLPEMVDRLDGMLIGGGHLIRFDQDVAPGYRPPAPEIHHPTGYWLGPALLCLDHGCPIAWNAVGAYGAVPAWADPLMHLAIGRSRHIAVRDEDARAALAPFAGGRDIAIVPDTCFGIASLLQGARSAGRPSGDEDAADPPRPYIVIQATDGLDAFIALVARHPERFAAYRFLALPLGAALGDDVALLGRGLPNLMTLPAYPHPERIARLVAGADAVVGSSLHLAITAIAFGVPAFRPAHVFGGKYAVLARHATVHPFAVDADIALDWFEARLKEHDSTRAMADISAGLERHWDAVAAAFSAGRERAARPAAWLQVPALLEHAREPPGPLEQALAQRDARIGELDAALAGHARDLAGRDALIAERDAEIARRDAALAERAREIFTRDAEVARRGRVIAAAQAKADRALLDAKVRKDKLAAMRGSASWRLTAPLRWAGRLARGATAQRAPIIRLDRIAQQTLASAPYHWAFANGLFGRSARDALVRTYPCDNYKTVKGYDGEKGYEYEARALIHMNARTPSFPEGLSDAWRRLAEDLLSPAYRAAMTRLTGRDLSTAPMEAYVCHFGPGAWLGPHVDLKEKIVTHVFYFNARWEPENGGCLDILGSRDMSDIVAEISPIVGNSAIVVRSDRSWHSVSRVTNGCRTSRRSMNVIFYHPGAVSTMWPPGETPALHRYETPSDAR